MMREEAVVFSSSETNRLHGRLMMIRRRGTSFAESHQQPPEGRLPSHDATALPGGLPPPSRGEPTHAGTDGAGQKEIIMTIPTSVGADEDWINQFRMI